MEPIVRHLRRYCTEYVGRQNTDALDDLLEPDYVLSVGGDPLLGRDAFKTAARGVFAQFPTIDVAMREIVTDGDRVAARFTERSSWTARPDRSAIWDVVVLFTWNGVRFTSCWVEQDFLGRREQLHRGVPRVVPLDGADPWAAAPAPLDGGAAEVAGAGRERGEPMPGEAVPLFDVDKTQIDEL